jgi:hypothetical protein
MDELLRDLTREARTQGLNDARWAAAAGVRKETLSRLRRRGTGDHATLTALAAAVGARIGVRGAGSAATTADGHFPVAVDRAYAERLGRVAASGNLDPDAWRAEGPGFFVAGLAVALASGRGMDRTRLLALAEALHPGASQPEAFACWLERSPLRPSQFMPAVRAMLSRPPAGGDARRRAP